MEKRKPSYTVGGNASWCSHYGEQYEGPIKKLKTELPCDPAVSLLGIYLNKTINQKDICRYFWLSTLPLQGARFDPTCHTAKKKKKTHSQIYAL